MKILEFTANAEQRRELEGLAYWIADKEYIIERWGIDEPEIKRCHDTIHFIFDKCDELKIPFWVQNNVICFAENWRRYKSEYLTEAMKKHRIYL